MGKLEPCRIDDIVSIARLHRQIYHHNGYEPSPALISYYKKVFFENPWRNDDNSPLVWRENDGTVSGFMGIIPRPMLYDDRPITMAVAHRLLVSRRAPNASLIAARLVRACLRGRHDLFLSDGSSDAGRRIVQASGAIVLPQYSMKWVCLLRPVSWFTNLGKSRGRIRFLANLASPVSVIIDTAVRRLQRSEVARSVEGGVVEPLTVEDLLTSIELASARLVLRPQYQLDTLQWMLSLMSSDTHRGVLRGFTLRRDGRLVGCCLFHAKPRAGYEVIALLAMNATEYSALFNKLLNVAYCEGATHVFGRFEPRLAEPLFSRRCFLQAPGCWTVAYSSDKRILELVKSGELLLTNLEAELWLGVPTSYDD